MTTKRPTSFDIAALAGVSQATVSRALSQSTAVSEAVRQRVLQAAEQLNYTVDVNARKLRSKKINTIAVLISEDLEKSESPINPFFMPMIGSILKYAGEKGYDVLVSLQKQSDNWGSDYGHARRADGIIFLGYNDYETYTRKVAVLGEMGEPWVLWGPIIPEHPNLAIGSDNEGGAYSAVRHLIGLGRKRIAFLGEPSASHLEYRERFDGYVRALDEAGIDTDPKLLIDCFISREEGVAAIERLMAEGTEFDGVFCVADLLAMGAIQQLTRAGKSVPSDISVMGFDDLWAGACTTPALSTVRQDTTAAAVALVDALGVLIDGKMVEMTRIPTQLIVRESCGG